MPLMKEEDYLYHCEITREMLANREQEYHRRNNEQDYESEFDEDDCPDSLRWVRDITISFADKDFENIIKRIGFEYNNGKGKKDIIKDDEYIYFQDDHWLIKDKMLFRDKIFITHSATCDISVSDICSEIENSYKS